MVTIETRYIGATNHRSSRIKATIISGYQEAVRSITIVWDDVLSSAANHEAAARACAEKYNVRGIYAKGESQKGNIYVRFKTSEYDLETIML